MVSRKDETISPERAFLEVVERMLELLARWIESEGEPRAAHKRVRFRDQGCREESFVEHDYLDMFHKHITAVVEEIDDVDEKLVALRKAEIIRYPNGMEQNPENLKSARGYQVWPMAIIVCEMIMRYNSRHLTREQITQEFAVITPLRKSNTRKLETNFLLGGFKSDVSGVRIDEVFELLAITNEQKTEHIGSQLIWHGLMELDAIERSTFVMRTTEDLTGESEPAQQRIEKEANSLVTACRLLKPGDISIACRYTRCLTDYCHSEGDSLSMPPPSRTGRMYNLAESDVSELERLVSALKRLEGAQFYSDMEVALRRFNQSYTRTIPEDILLDLTIALESTLLAKERDKLKYRLSLRGAALLSESKIPSITQQLLGAMYDARSAVVHDGKHIHQCAKECGKVQKALADHTINGPLTIWEDLVRDVLREYTPHVQWEMYWRREPRS